MTADPLKPRAGVMPGAPAQERAVYFEVVVEEVDSRWKDILGIGFSADNPSDWPEGRPPPRYASKLRNAWLWGYDCSWVVSGRAAMLRPSDLDPKVWGPAHRLKPGDTIGALIKSPECKPAVFAIFINGKL